MLNGKYRFCATTSSRSEPALLNPPVPSQGNLPPNGCLDQASQRAKVLVGGGGTGRLFGRTTIVSGSSKGCAANPVSRSTTVLGYQERLGAGAIGDVGGVGLTIRSRPSVSTAMWRLRPTIFLPAS